MINSKSKDMKEAGNNETGDQDLDKINRLKCDICGKTFSSNNYLKYHVTYVHSEQKMFICEFCKKSFNSPNNLKVHVRRLHNPHRHHFCDKCNANFGLQYDLKVHMRTHIREQEFKCEFCGKLLSNKRRLEEHTRTHTLERPYICPLQYCGLRFGQRKTLRIHER